jgi:hypothetical protein
MVIYLPKTEPNKSSGFKAESPLYWTINRNTKRKAKELSRRRAEQKQSGLATVNPPSKRTSQWRGAGRPKRSTAGKMF